MTQVNKDQFYAHVMDQEAIIVVDTDYNTIYQMRHTHKVIGKSVESVNKSEAAIGEGQTYYISL